MQFYPFLTKKNIYVYNNNNKKYGDTYFIFNGHVILIILAVSDFPLVSYLMYGIL